MIAVIAKKEELATVEEFFELFKTPWEIYQNGKYYDVVIMTDERPLFDINTKILFIYNTKQSNFDIEYSIPSSLIENAQEVHYNKFSFPVYNNVRSFLFKDTAFLKTENAERAAGFIIYGRQKIFIRIGYDLFKEIFYLLNRGQFREYALVPTVDLHIKIMRDMIIQADLPLVEILPLPARYNCIACLTHDVDFMGIRNHIFDRTMLGFLYRASIGSCINYVKKKIPFSVVRKNFVSVLLLPFVYLRIAKDFLVQLDKYAQIENELGATSTFFFVPFENCNGRNSGEKYSNKRAVKYDLNSCKEIIQKLISKGHEIGVHGLDAWCDYERAALEFNRLKAIVKNGHMGIRMHWLFFDEGSPAILDKAGFLYDSTVGYNDAVGFKAGTAQVFKPAGCSKLLELPMQIQDSALFFPKRMNIKNAKAMRLVHQIIKLTALFGGVITINWHERSLGPERYWDKFYIHLIKKLKKQNAWFASTSSVIRWFQYRRNISFQDVYCNGENFTIQISGIDDHDLPGLVLRIYLPKYSKTKSLDYVVANSCTQREEIVAADFLKIAIGVN